MLETPLIFTPLTTAAATASTHSITKSAVAHSNDSVKSSMANATVVLDINHSFWAHLQSAFKDKTNSITRGNNITLPAADLTVCDFPGSTWSVAANAEVMHYMVSFVLFSFYCGCCSISAVALCVIICLFFSSYTYIGHHFTN